MASNPRAGVLQGQVIATILDKFGEPRQVVQRGSRIRIANTSLTPIMSMTREIGVPIGERIRALREERGWSLEEMAIRCGIVSGWPKNRMYEIERGSRKTGIRLGTIYAVAAALGVEVGVLLPPVDDILNSAGVKATKAKYVTLSSRGRVVA